MRLIRFSLAILILFVALPSYAATRGPDVLVLLFPFEMHSQKDISSERSRLMEALASSLHKSGAGIVGLEEIKSLMLDQGVSSFGDADAHALAKTVKADFAVLGSITRLGAFTEVNWRVIDLTNKSTLAFYVKSSSSVGDLIRKFEREGKPMYALMYSAMKARPAVKSGIIDRIAVTGNRRVDTEAVMKKLASREGEPYNPDDVREDIRSIYGTGYFSDIFADLSDSASGKILTFVVKEMPFIRKVEFKGNKGLDDEKITTAVTIKENTVLDSVLLGENAEKIKGLYAREGYYLATVKPVVDSDGLEANVVFEIDEGPAVKVKRITIIGANFFSARKLKRLMNTKEKGLFSFATNSGKFDEFAFQNDLAIIMREYFDNGFIKSDILDHRVLLSEDKKWFYITIALVEGDQYRVGTLDVTGEIISTRDELIDKLKLKTGRIFNRSALSKGLDAIADVYGDEGYAYADINPMTAVDTEKKIIDLMIEIKKNELVYVERIDITGNVRTRDKVIRRELEVGEGELFNSSAIKRSRNNLRRLGYFEGVELERGRGSAGDKLKLNIDVKERPTGAISIGLGYSSVDKLIATTSISQSNFMGTGMKLNVSGTRSASSSRYVIGFTQPWLFDKPISAGFDLYDTDKQYPDFDLHKKGGDLRLGFPITKRYTRGYLTYKRENVNISEVALTASSLIKDQEGNSTESSMKAVMRRDTRNDAFFPSEGSVVTLTTEFAGGPLGGTNYFIRYEGDAVKFFPLPRDTSISFRGRLGHLQGYSGHVPPIYKKYYLGGISSIRGFETRSVGPRDAVTGEFIGGNTMAVFNTEFVFPLVKKQSIRGLVFFDAGNAYQGKIDFADLRTAAGLGIRWYSPLGPLRLELGFNLDRRTDEKSRNWEFTIGSVF